MYLLIGFRLPVSPLIARIRKLSLLSKEAASSKANILPRGPWTNKCSRIKTKTHKMDNSQDLPVKRPSDMSTSSFA